MAGCAQFGVSTVDANAIKDTAAVVESFNIEELSIYHQKNVTI